MQIKLENTLLVITILGNNTEFLGLLEGVERNVVKADGWLVGVLDKDVLAIGLLHDHVHKGSDNGPAVVEVQVHLGSELARLVAQNPEDNVVIC